MCGIPALVNASIAQRHRRAAIRFGTRSASSKFRYATPLRFFGFNAFDPNAYSTRHSSGLRLFFRLFFYRIFDSPLDFSSSDSLTFLSTAFSSSGSSTPFLPTLRLHFSTSSAFPTSRSSFLRIIRLLLFSASFSTRFRSISMRRRALVPANTFDHLLPASNGACAISGFKLWGASSADSALRR